MQRFTGIGQHTLVEKRQLAFNGLLVFPFQHFQQQGELGDFHRLRVDVHAVDIVQQNAFALVGGEAPLVVAGFVDRRLPSL
ncbi:MAG: hypothetical protein IH987_13270, partial [Planctomycetes bacterium]|nr:hypothetical protein [Planctomycetota bacterium]